MAKKVTIQQIADELRISKSTVSKAISGATDISEKTRQTILHRAAEMGYEINQEKTPKSRNVAVLVHSIHYGNSEQFGYGIIAGIQTAAIENGFGVNVIPVPMEQVTSGNYDRLAVDRGYEGLFFLGFRPHMDFIERNREKNLPMVVLDDYMDSPTVARVGSDTADGIRKAVRYLYDKGHTRIGFLGGEEDSNVTQERKNAYVEALKGLGIQPDDSLIQYGHFSGKGTGKRVAELIKQKVTAVVCVSDILASAAIGELAKKGYRVPEDVSITGYDDLPIAKYTNPPLTTIAQDRLGIGKLAFYALRQIKNGIHISSVMLHTSLVERESVADLSETAADPQISEMCRGGSECLNLKK